MKSFSNYGWLEFFWELMIFEEFGFRWQLHTLFDGDFSLRDPLAHGLLRERLSNRSDIDYRFDRAWGGNKELLPLGERENLILLGRAKPFYGSRISPWSGYLESRGCGRFLDPTNGQAGGTAGATVRRRRSTNDRTPATTSAPQSHGWRGWGDPAGDRRAHAPPR